MQRLVLGGDILNVHSKMTIVCVYNAVSGCADGGFSERIFLFRSLGEKMQSCSRLTCIFDNVMLFYGCLIGIWLLCYYYQIFV